MYLVAVLFAAFVCFSCSDDDDNDTYLDGNYKYSNVHFKFDYAEETITLPEGIIPPGYEQQLGSTTEISVDAVKELLPAFAHANMKKYFNGIKFDKNGGMEISYNLDGAAKTLKTTYEIQGSLINVSLQSDDFKTILAGMNIPINSISLNYSQAKDQLTIYLDTKYIKTLLTAFSTILPAIPSLTEEQKKMISDILTSVVPNIKTLEIGAILKAE